MMIPIIMNTNFEKLCVIDDYISFIWATRYTQTGDFELCLDLGSKALNYIKKDYFVLRDDDSNVGIIQRIRIERDDDAHETMIVSGKFLDAIVSRRIIAKQTQLYGRVDACIQTLLEENVIDPINAERKIPNFSFESSLPDNLFMQQQFTGDNLLEAIDEICEKFHLGHRTILNGSGFKFQLYAGVDRSYNQNVNPRVIFSDEFDNLLSSEYEENYEKIVTDVLVAGEGEGIERKTVWTDFDPQSGLARFEAYADARNASTNGGEIDDATYYAQLKEDGLEDMVQITRAFSGKVYFGSYVYKKDVNLGDVCVIENKRWGIYINSRLIEVIESVSESGEYSITPTFGN